MSCRGPASVRDAARAGFDMILHATLMDDEALETVVDLKTPNSGEMMRNRMENIQYLSADDQLKLVICNRRDYEWAVTQVAEHQLNRRCTVIFSPSYQELDATELAGWILQDKLDVRMQVQLHKILWGDKQGV